MPEPAKRVCLGTEPAQRKGWRDRPNSYAVKKAAWFNKSVDGHVLTNRGRKFAMASACRRRVNWSSSSSRNINDSSRMLGWMTNAWMGLP